VSRPTWDETWLAVAHQVAQRSLCVRAQVGAVIVNTHNRIVATGYNGPPAGFWHNEDACWNWCTRGHMSTVWPEKQQAPAHDYSDCPSLHAEANALLSADRSTWQGGTLYVTGACCLTCAKSVANSGLSRVVYAEETVDRSYRQPATVTDYLRACGLVVESHTSMT